MVLQQTVVIPAVTLALTAKRHTKPQQHHFPSGQWSQKHAQQTNSAVTSDYDLKSELLWYIVVASSKWVVAITYITYDTLLYDFSLWLTTLEHDFSQHKKVY
jgi:hypothetical protein